MFPWDRSDSKVVVPQQRRNSNESTGVSAVLSSPLHLPAAPAARAPAADQLTLAQYVIRDCKARGLRHFFGIPGSGSPMDLMDAAREEGLEFVISGHESSAVISAAYYGAFTGGATGSGTPGLMVGIKGVGMGNAVGGAVNASTERMPVVVICEARASKVPRALPLAQHTGVDQAAFFGDQVRYAGSFGRGDVAETWHAATAHASACPGRPGASFVDLPGDLGRAPVDAAAAEALAAAATERAAAWADRAGAPADRIAAAAAVLARHRRPVLVVGADVVRDGACDAFGALARGPLRAAVITTMEARGAFDETDDRWAGVLVSRTSPLVIETKLLAEADCIVLCGVDSYMVENPFLKPLPTVVELAAHPAHGSLTDTRGILAGDASAAQNAGGAPDAVRLDGHLRKTLEALAVACAAPPAAGAFRGGAGYGFDAVAVRAIRQHVLDECFRRPATSGLTANDIIETTRRLLPAHGVVFAETGVFVCMLEHLWPAARPRTFFGTSGGRSMGLTVPALLGAKLAAGASTPMVGFGGDGSLLMRLGELESFGRLAHQLRGTPLVVINDQALGTMQARQRSRKMAPYSLAFHGVDFAAVARACGMGAATVSTAAEFEAALAAALDPAAPPTLIDARVDARAYQDSFAKTVGNAE
eukprot:g4716.t1